jgi:hypothetical protein
MDEGVFSSFVMHLSYRIGLIRWVDDKAHYTPQPFFPEMGAQCMRNTP